MIADAVRDTELADYQRTVRTLLVHPLVTATHPTDGALASVRRFAQPLQADLTAVAGYRLVLEPTCARLVRRIDRLDDTPSTRRADRKPFDRRRYAYLALVLAALGRAGSQVALTELADALRRRAVEIDGLGFDPDAYRHRLAFVDVVRHLLTVGALREVETSTVDWVRDPDAGEALYDVDRDAVHLTVVPARVVQHVGSVADLLAGAAMDATTVSRDTRRASIRQRLARLLLEHPVVLIDDLDAAERAYLTSQAASLTADLQRLTGGQVERRAEGLALIDATGGFTDQRFPSGGTPAQVALLLADAMAGHVDHCTEQDVEVARAAVATADERSDAIAARLDAARPSAFRRVDDGGDDSREAPRSAVVASDRGAVAGGDAEVPAASGPLFTDTWLRDRVDALIASHGRAFASDLRGDPDALLAAALDVLAAFDLVQPVAGGVVARPPLARYRDPVVTVAAPPQPSLLDGAFDDAADDRSPAASPDLFSDLS